MSLGDKIVIVTGAACGIGLATARLFAARGAHIVIAEPPVQKCCRQNSTGGVDQFGRGTSIAGVICNWKGAVTVLNLPLVDTVPNILLRNAVRFADRSVMREKQFGIWRE
jgi:NAD(P)-dependent dehydrogenase (short-subunit alcohol dehydrogenase family)